MKRAPSRARDLPAALILAFALLISSQRLVITGWTEGLEFTSVMVLTGILLGLPLGASRFRPWTLAALALGYGLVLLPMLAAAAFYPGLAWRERLAALSERLASLSGQFIAGDRIKDSFLFVVFISILYWIIGLACSWTLTRRGDFLGAILPGGLLLTIVQLYDRREVEGTALLAIYLLLALLLLGRLAYLDRRAGWQARRVRSAKEALASLNVMFVVSALALVGLAWLLPAVARPWTAIREFWEENTGDLWERTGREFDEATSGLDQEGRSPLTSLYGSTLALGQQAPTGNTVYLRVMLPSAQNQERYYWRARAYDEYRADGWHTGNASRGSLSPASSPLQLPGRQGLVGEFTFHVVETGVTTLVTPSRPVWLDWPAALTYLPAGEGALDPILFQPDPPVRNGERYVVHAELSSPTIRQLRAAGTDYPGWVSERYLQLPADLPPQLEALAGEITAGAATPYDKAEAVTAYLRRAIAYSPVVEPVPAGRDPLVEFLFERRTGFCNHFATAAVILLRAAGVPSRLAVGFAEGEATSHGWRSVRARDAHTWPEVYFPGLGWVEFEPTTNQAAIARPAGDAQETASAVAALPGGQATREEPRGLPAAGQAGDGPRRPANSLARILLGFVVFAAVIVGLAMAYSYHFFERLARRARALFPAPPPVLLRNYMVKHALETPVWLERWAYVAGLTPAGRAFRAIYRALDRLGMPADPARTPAEASSLLAMRLPEAAPVICSLLGEYERSMYGRRPGQPDPEAARLAGKAIRKSARLARWRNRRGALRRFFVGRGQKGAEQASAIPVYRGPSGGRGEPG